MRVGRQRSSSVGVQGAAFSGFAPEFRTAPNLGLAHFDSPHLENQNLRPSAALPAFEALVSHRSHAAGSTGERSVLELNRNQLPTTPRASEFLFVDPAVSDLDTILGNLRPEVHAIVLNARWPAARQIAIGLAGRQDLDTVHVIAHGAPGRVSFTAGDWSAETLEDEADDFAVIGEALGEGGELRLWSCDSAAGPAGATFVEALAKATGACVAAADARVGAQALGGVWELAERASLEPPHPPLTAAGIGAYAGILAAIEITVSGRVPDVSTAGSTTYFVVDKDKNAIVGNITLPNTPKPHSAFRIPVRVPSSSESFDVGVFDDAGGFVSAGFTVEVPKPPSGAVGATE